MIIWFYLQSGHCSGPGHCILGYLGSSVASPASILDKILFQGNIVSQDTQGPLLHLQPAYQTRYYFRGIYCILGDLGSSVISPSSILDNILYQGHILYLRGLRVLCRIPVHHTRQYIILGAHIVSQGTQGPLSYSRPTYQTGYYLRGTYFISQGTYIGSSVVSSASNQTRYVFTVISFTTKLVWSFYK